MPSLAPLYKPANPCFSSGPCAKHPGFRVNQLDNAVLGRSHRGVLGKARLQQAIDLTREILCIPDDYRIGIVPGSDTGAVEMALWSMLGPRPVDVLAWEAFGLTWVSDITQQLKLPNVRHLYADYGDLPDLSQVNPAHDIVFTWNGTTSGVRVPNGDWIAADRGGLTICDATSAAFAQPLPWDKLDCTTFSWQKALGGEAAHGMIVLSPRAVERLETYQPPWPMPKLFRMTNKGKLSEGIFKGETINTPSMLCVEDYIEALKWAQDEGGAPGLFARADANLAVISDWVARTPWAEFLAHDATTRSNTSVCLKIVSLDFINKSDEDKTRFIKRFAAMLSEEGVAYDIEPYRDAPPGLRIWCGATVETSDLECLTKWLDWAMQEMQSNN